MNRLLASVALFIVVILPTPALAAGGLVPCDGPDCDICSVVSLAHNGLNFLILASTLIATILFAYAGFQMLVNAENSGAISKAKGIFTEVLIGFVILLASWLIIDTVMRVLFTDSQFGNIPGAGKPWQDILCSYRSQPPLTPPPTTTTTTTTTAGGGGQQGFSTLDELNIGHKGMCAVGQTSGCACANNPTGTCSVQDSLKPGLTSLKQQIPDLTLTEAYPPTLPTCQQGQSVGCHFDPCHAAGTCVDVRAPGGLANDGNINLMHYARANGLRAVYEVSDITAARTFARDLIADPRFANQYPNVTAAQIGQMDEATLESTFHDIEVLGSHVTGTHFSLYGPGHN